MADNPDRPENGDRPPTPKPDQAGAGRRAEMTQAAVEMAKANRLEAELARLKPSSESSTSSSSSSSEKSSENKKADPGPMERTLERKPPPGMGL